MFQPPSKEVLAHDLALGQLCGAWATLDRGVNELLAVILKVDAAQMACIATEMDPVASRVRLTKKLLHTLCMPGWWTDGLTQVLNIIENEVGPLRNRCIHDSWRLSEGQPIRKDRRAFLKKLEARGNHILQFDLEHTMKPDDIVTLNVDIMLGYLALKGAQCDLEDRREMNTLSPKQSLLCPVVDTWEDRRKERPR